MNTVHFLHSRGLILHSSYHTISTVRRPLRSTRQWKRHCLLYKSKKIRFQKGRKYPSTKKNDRVCSNVSCHFSMGFFPSHQLAIYIAVLHLKQRATHVRSQWCKEACDSAKNQPQTLQTRSLAFDVFQTFLLQPLTSSFGLQVI